MSKVFDEAKKKILKWLDALITEYEKHFLATEKGQDFAYGLKGFRIKLEQELGDLQATEQERVKDILNAGINPIVSSSYDAGYAKAQAEAQKTLKEQIIRLGQVRAGNIGQIWDAGWAYGLLMLLGKAPQFKTREEAYEWAKKNICCFRTAKEAEKLLEGQAK